jgi:hypothetical protein
MSFLITTLSNRPTAPGALVRDERSNSVIKQVVLTIED